MTLSPLASRIIAWGLLANLCWGFGAFLISPFFKLVKSDREAVSSSQQLLGRYGGLQRGLPLLRAELEQLKGRVSAENHYFLSSSSPALAAAEMQNAVKAMVSQSGAIVRSSKTLAPTSEQGFDRVGIDVELAASTAELTRLLQIMAKAEPVVLVERLLAQVPENGVTSPAPDGQPGVTVTLRLISYLKHTQNSARS